MDEEAQRRIAALEQRIVHLRAKHAREMYVVKHGWELCQKALKDMTLERDCLRIALRLDP